MVVDLGRDAADRRRRNLAGKRPPGRKPAELKSTLVFGAIYAAIIFATAAAKDTRRQALYAVAVVGIVDVDAMALSTAQLVAVRHVDPTTTWRVVMVACSRY